MKSIYLHEVSSAFTGFSAYVFGAFLLLFGGIYTLAYNHDLHVAEFQYVLQNMSFLFIFIIPVVTMRVWAEERRQKTEQLLYALPISTTQVILGKYAALLLVFLIPLCFVALYPLLFSQFGEVYLPTAYGSLFAFFLLGAALIAVGVFLSSLTDNQGLAAGLGIGAILLNYYSVSLSEYVSSTAIGSLVTFAVLIVCLGLIIRALTRNDMLSIAVGLVLLAALIGVYALDGTALEGLLPDIMKTLSLFSRFSVFVNGVFDLTGVVYFLSVTVFFLFLAVQSMEKRRYN